MQWRFTWLALVCVAMLAPGLHAESRTTVDVSTWVVARHQMLQSSLDRIAARSRLWREAWHTLEGSGRHVLLLTPEHVKVQDRASGGNPRPFNAELVAETYPITLPDSRVETVVVVVNVPLLRTLYHSQPWSTPADVHDDLDRIVIHEVYGHALPYLLAGNIAGRCPDALPGQRASDACAIQRENAVRKELQLGVRQDAGLSGLVLVNRAVSRSWVAAGAR